MLAALALGGAHFTQRIAAEQIVRYLSNCWVSKEMKSLVVADDRKSGLVVQTGPT